jgi:hypothetical protein
MVGSYIHREGGHPLASKLSAQRMVLSETKRGIPFHVDY